MALYILEPKPETVANKFASIQCYDKYGILRSQMKTILDSHLHIAHTVKPALSYYKLLMVGKEELEKRLDNLVNGNMVRFDRLFVIVWKTPRGEFLSSSDDSVWRLSFREAKPEFNLPAYVLISRSKTVQTSLKEQNAAEGYCFNSF